MNRLILTFLLPVLGACSQEPTRTSTKNDLPESVVVARDGGSAARPVQATTQLVKWVPAPNNSVVASVDGKNATEGLVHRCWRKSAGLSCLAVDEFSQPIVFHYLATSLPTSLEDLRKIKGSGGYHCFRSSGNFTHEAITNSSGRDLVTNLSSGSYSSSSQPWESGYVKQFLSENEIAAAKLPFNCAALAEVISSGSRETLATTAVQHDDYVGI